MAIRVLVPLAAALAALVLPAGARAAAPPPFGGLSPFAAPSCFVADADGGCAVDTRIGNQADVVATATRVYVAGSRLLVFDRRADGALGALIDCVARPPATGCGTTDDLLFNARHIAVSPGRAALYAAVGNTTSSSAVLAFRLLADGTIGDRFDCVSEQAQSGCTDSLGLDTMEDVAVHEERDELYTASKGTAGGIASFGLAADGSIGAESACATQSPVFGCTSFTLTLAAQVLPAGDTLYATWFGQGGNDSGVTAWDLSPTGVIGTLRNCVASNSVDEAACPAEASSLRFPMTLSAAGPQGPLVVGGGDGITALALDVDGSLGTRRSCLTGSPVAGCTTVPGMDQTPYALTTPADGTLYAALREDGVYALRTDAAGAPVALIGCVRGAPGDGCADVPGGHYHGVARAPDGLAVYAAGESNGAVVALRRQVAPTCPDASAATAAPAPVVIPAACTDPNQDPLALEVVAPPASGTAGVDAAGKLVYTPAAGTAGAVTFTFRASDGTLVSAPATATVAVTAAPAPPAAERANLGPDSSIDRIARRIRAARLRTLRGRASDRDGRVARVEVAVVRCRRGFCRPRGWARAKGTTRWTYRLRRRLAPARYVLYARAVDDRGARETSFSARDGNRRVIVVVR